MKEILGKAKRDIAEGDYIIVTVDGDVESEDIDMSKEGKKHYLAGWVKDHGTLV